MNVDIFLDAQVPQQMKMGSSAASMMLWFMHTILLLSITKSPVPVDSLHHVLQARHNSLHPREECIPWMHEIV